jgi:branched-chain amino acid transport system permease protein
VPDAVTTAAATPVAGEEGLAATATETARAEHSTAYWLLLIGGLFFVLAGWLLPWFPEPTANGVGFSPQDAAFSFTGVGTVLTWIIGVSMLALIAGAAYDAYALRTRRATPFRWLRERAVLAAAGVVSTLLIWYLISVQREEPLFGNISKFAVTDNAVWMTLIGFAALTLACGFRSWIIDHPTIAFGPVVFIFGALFPFIFNQAADFIYWGASFAAIYTLLALGLNVVVGFAGLLDLGYAAFFAIGAYTAGSMASPRHSLYLPFWVILFLGAAVAALFGAILGAPTLRLRGDYLAIVTLGFGEIVPDLATNNFLGQTGGSEGITGIRHPGLPGISRLNGDPLVAGGHNLFGTDFGIEFRYYFWALLIIITLVILVLRNLERSRLGRAWVAIREDEVAAAATGINTVSTKLLAFAIGASVSGFAGAFYGAELGIVTPEDFRFAVSVTALTTVVLGGIGNNTGAAVGGLLISFIVFWILPHLQEWMGTLGHTINVTSLGTIDYSKYTYIVYGVILIGIMLLRPGGLLPSRARKVELQTGTESESLAAVKGVA